MKFIFQIEHIQLGKLFEKMDELLGYPKFDPHGEPIPDKKGRIKDYKKVKLSECKIGANVQIVGLDDSSNEFIHFLNDRKISLGDIFKIEKIEKFDGSIDILQPNGCKQTLSKIICEKLLVN